MRGLWLKSTLEVTELVRVNYPDLSTVMDDSQESPFVVLNKVRGKHGRKFIPPRMRAAIKRLGGLQSKGKFAVVRCPLCHEFKIAQRGQKQARCGVCGVRFWLFNTPISANGDDHASVVAEMGRLRRRWLAALVR